jgi:hypothetical protein
MMNKTNPKDITMADCDFEFAKGSTQPKVCKPFAPEALMPPIYNLEACSYHGTCALGMVFSRNSPDEPMAHKATVTRQTQFDLNDIQDRKYEYFASTNDDGWLCGGGENGDHCKLPAKDSAHITIAEFGTLTAEFGGIDIERIRQILTNGTILIPHMCVIPSFVFKNPDNPPEVELKFELRKVKDNDSVEEWENWVLPFVYNQVFNNLHKDNPAIHGHMVRGDGRNQHYHVSLVRKAAWRSAEKMRDYFKNCSDAVARWRKRGSVCLEPETNPGSTGFVGENKALRNELTNPHGVYLYKTRQDVVDYFTPNFYPPYNTPEKRKIIEKWLLNVDVAQYTLSDQGIMHIRS